VPGEAPADELEVEVCRAQEDAGDQPAVPVDVDRHHVDVPPVDERRNGPLRGASEGLVELGAIDPVEAYPDRAPGAENAQGVTVVHGDNAAVERRRKCYEQREEGREHRWPTAYRTGTTPEVRHPNPGKQTKRAGSWPAPGIPVAQAAGSVVSAL
jgi:hypothetical protein